MIIDAILRLAVKLIGMMIPFDIPPFPDSVKGYLDIAYDYISAGAGVLANYVPLEYLMTLFTIIISVDIVIGAVHLVIWIYKKIPVFGGE